ncbi:50S ribosomal protein L23 [Luteolibacter sp. GHJ8]|jgi:large subunit ribosomal protein L23|uniref:Large ribosomal subunit protein uL23 n=1 Tax=Luteolibacter rhizosphaerae TaxID=2989719 RepID=A0ABT3FZ21_9BACT|nr:50S ribosomal protein L23 [Luteolibacter rhizosphaerae]MCW1912853.1 50S ribosomal protein L23 [Luteolibacter rhizosphaerae]
MKDIYQVIKNVRLSEKATMLQETNNEVTLEVDRKANKLDIKRAVETLLGKKVSAVRTANYAGKAKRKRRADEGRTNHWKKAIVRLKDGESLDLV